MTLLVVIARRRRSTAQGALASADVSGFVVAVAIATLIVTMIPCAWAASRSAIGAGGMSGAGLYDTWSVGYLYRQDLVAIEYDSGAGTEGAMERYFAAGRSDFAGLDYGLDDTTVADISTGAWQAARADPNDDTDGNQVWVPGSGVLQVPVAAVPWVFAYRLDALQAAGHTAPLVLSGPLVARMWMGEIRAWNHADLVALNPVLATVTAPLTLFCEASLYGSTPLLGATLDALYAPFAVWRASIAGEPVAWYQVAASNASLSPNGSVSVVAVTGGPSALLANATATDGALVFGTYAATRRAGAPLVPAASMRNPAGKTVTPTADAVAAALDDFAGVISTTAPDRMHQVLPAGGAGTTSWPMTAFALMAIATDIEAADCTYATYVLDFLGWALLNQQAADAAAADDAVVIVPPRFAKNAVDLMGGVRCNGATAFTAALIIGSGSPTPVYSLWAYAYDADPTADGATVHYTETRGNRAKAQILAGDVDFGPTNNDVEPEVHAAHPDLALLPVGAYPVVFCYNVPGLMKGGAPALVLSVDVAMRILLADITRWNHPDLVALNPDLAAHLPDAEILFVGKTGSSIYTGTVSRAFALHSPAFAAVYGNGSNNVAWPVAATNRSVVSTLDEYVDTLKTTPYAIAYTAHHVVLRQRNLREARFLNAGGSAPLEPTRETTLAAVDEVAAARGGIGSLDRLSFVVGATGPRAWPMANMALVLIHTATMPDPVRARQLVRWLYWTQTAPAAVHISNVTGVYGIASLPDVWSDVLAALVNVTVQGAYVNPLRPCFADGLLCSDAGTCDEALGRCACAEGRTGAHCEAFASNSSAGDGTGWSSGETAAVATSVSVAVVALACVACALAVAAFIATQRRKRGREDWEIDSDDIDLTEATVLGAGGYGVVYRTAWRGTDVAVKIMSSDANGATSSEARRAFADEVRVMCALRHPNVVLFMAACTRPPKMCIVMEYMALGSLYDLLHNELVPEVPHALVVKMAYQAAKGMHFLHSSGVVHRDLKSLNLLLDAKWNVKVSDFGLTRFKSDLARAAGGDAAQGTVQWLAPEVLEDTADVDYMQADVYAFGIVLWEMATRSEPYAGMSPASIAVSVIRDDVRPPLPTLAPADYVALVQECWHRDPVMRPAFVDIQRRLTDAIKHDASSSSSSSSSRSGALGHHHNHHRHHHHHSHGDPASSSSSSSFSMSSMRGATLSGSSLHHVGRRSDGGDSPRMAHTRNRTLSNAVAGLDGKGTAAIVIADVDRADALWEAHPEAMRDATLLCNDILRDLTRKHSGVEVGVHGAATAGAGCMCVIFCEPTHARAWCADAQVALLDAPWPRALLKAHEAAAEVWIDDQEPGQDARADSDETTRRRLYAGLRVRMAVHVGRPRWHREPGAVPTCSGPDVHLCCRLAASAAGGRVLLTADAANAMPTGNDAHRDNDTCATRGVADHSLEKEATVQQQHEPYTVHRLTAVKDKRIDGDDDNDDDDDDDAGPNRNVSVYELRPRALEARQFGQVASVALPRPDPDMPSSSLSQNASIKTTDDADKAHAGAGLLASANACRWIIPYDEIDLREHVGAGSCAMVYRGRWKGIDVAVKRFANQRVDERRRIEFRAETAALAALRHPYVVAFVGACVAPPDLCVVTEFVRRGSMRRVLDDPTVKITWTERMRMLRTAAVGVAYLHGAAGIVHRDLKSSNLLVMDDCSVKVADFGFARIKEANATMTRCGTPCWTAPEVIRGARYSEKVDVYSFGIVMWEVVTRRRPFADRGFADVALAVLDGVRPTIPSSCPPDLAELMAACWDADPDVRPSMEEVVARLDAIALAMDRRDAPSLRPDIERGSL
ncbi:serine-threonine kinase [Pandoravirus neocaledonia]|uniref:Serine/threonine protein kinase n=1 Tax=Pandoravirus neocaledonia TaxID=2107708 RepID=A0A2U7UDR8_9VIRU|nr:serine-threonine kinase [Pandoravirus neocaledonia]AVK76566.1 Serine/threonine protein kinase [Pandoravirus neocaledonia]